MAKLVPLTSIPITHQLITCGNRTPQLGRRLSPTTTLVLEGIKVGGGALVVSFKEPDPIPIPATEKPMRITINAIPFHRVICLNNLYPHTLVGEVIAMVAEELKVGTERIVLRRHPGHGWNGFIPMTISIPHISKT